MLALVSLSIVLTWLACAVVLIGMGSLILEFFSEKYLLTEAFWTGLCATVAILEIYHFLRPVDLALTVALIFLGTLGIFRHRISLLQKLRQSCNDGPWQTFCYIVVVCAIALRASGACEHYDTGFYGAMVVRWIETYPVVPGLTNLFGRLGFNSSVFLCVTALGQGIWRDLAHHLFVELLLAALFASIIPAWFRLFRERAALASDWFPALLLVPATFWATNGEIVGTNTDLPASMGCLAAAVFLFRALDGDPRESGEIENCSASLVAAMLLFSLAVTFKLSSAVFAFTGWMVAFLRLWSLSRGWERRKFLIGAATALSAAIVLPWILRSIVLSGYPLYPSTLFPVPVEWKVPFQDASLEGAWVRSWARIPHASLSETQGFHWIGAWFRPFSRNREGFLIPLMISIAGFAATAYSRITRKIGKFSRGKLVLLPAGIGLVSWFFTAPALRFGEAFIWTAAATLGSLGANAVWDAARPNYRRMVLAFLLLITAWCIYPRTLWPIRYRPLLAVHGFLRLPEGDTVSRKTSSGLTVYMPAEGNQCWDTPLPCSPYFRRSLRLRNPESLKNGFISDAKLDDFVPLPHAPEP
jgi:hypothetical protein